MKNNKVFFINQRNYLSLTNHNNKMKKIFYILVIALIPLFSIGQVVTFLPTFVGQNDTVTVVYDASKGNGELAGINQLYAHTGVITNVSSSNTDWLHVQGTWGTADNKVKMTSLGNDLHEIKYHINSFYNVPSGETVSRLAFVFRNADGSKVGRVSDGSDIFVDLYQGGYDAKIITPDEDGLIVQLNDNIVFKAEASELSSMSLFRNGSLINQQNNTKILTSNIDVSIFGKGKHVFTMVSTNGTSAVSDTFYYVVKEPVTSQNPPSGTIDGINYLNDTSVIVQLVAPYKNFVYVVGDFNNWEYDPHYYMKRNTSGNRWWVQINGLTPGQEYRFQYVIDDGNLRVADVYSDKILDPWNDKWIDNNTYPNLTPYPVGKTIQPVSVMQTAQVDYAWDTSINFTKPSKKSLVVYELLLRDFTKEHTWQSLIDSMNYFTNIGINAIELMPIMEFEANESWGYNPAFYFAPDKYYGTKNKLKEFVEECHRNGIAVLLDIALNHSFGMNPQVRMYFDASAGQWGQPTSNNPWFNPIEKHPFNVGYDYNHESTYTKDFMKRILGYWVEEFHVDGYRLDLSKGFTQTYSGTNVGQWGQYDQGRVDILKEYADHLWSVDPTSFMILEHFADNSEETVLANYGMMLWGNIHEGYKEASLGYGSDFSWGLKDNRGWNDHNLISYAVSHDEERLMVENLNFGNATTGYNLKDSGTALLRQELTATFLVSVPGPKMIWQFDELGYDYSIEFNGRTGNKPIRWDYLEDARRYRLHQVYSAITKLKTSSTTFATANYNVDVSGYGKSIHLNHSDMDATIVGNFKMDMLNMIPSFQHTGMWYDYITGDSLNVTDVNMSIDFLPGEYHVYLDKKLEAIELSRPEIISVEDLRTQAGLTGYPNPFATTFQINFSIEKTQKVTVEIMNLEGKTIKTVLSKEIENGNHAVYWNGETQTGGAAKNGVYFYTIETGSSLVTRKVVLNR